MCLLQRRGALRPRQGLRDEDVSDGGLVAAAGAELLKSGAGRAASSGAVRGGSSDSVDRQSAPLLV